MCFFLTTLSGLSLNFLLFFALNFVSDLIPGPARASTTCTNKFFYLKEKIILKLQDIFNYRNNFNLFKYFVLQEKNACNNSNVKLEKLMQIIYMHPFSLSIIKNIFDIFID